MNFSGRHYNHNGELEDWWNHETSVKYEKKSKCFLKAYDTYNSTFGGILQKVSILIQNFKPRNAIPIHSIVLHSPIQVNSSTTLGEDISDNVGFKAALFAYRNYVSEKGNEPLFHNFEDFTSEQLFSLAFANVRT